MNGSLTFTRVIGGSRGEGENYGKDLLGHMSRSVFLGNVMKRQVHVGR